MRTIPKLAITTLAVALCAMPAVQVSAVGNKKIIPGSSCYRTDGGTFDIEYSSGRARQTTSTSRTLICPIIRDVPTADLVDARVRVVAPSGGGGVSCTLKCCTTSGLSCDSNLQSAADGSGDETLYFDPIDSEDDGPCVITCVLNAVNERLRWYESEE